MNASSELKPRNGSTLSVLVVARISGCQNQKELSLDDQVEHAHEEIAELTELPANFHVIKTVGKGERLDRPELKEVEDRIELELDDILIMEDVGRLVRGTAASKIWGNAVDRRIRCIAPNDGLDTINESWEEELISACQGHVSHCAHTSRRIKKKQMTRFVRNGGAIPLPIFGYIKPEGAKHYSEWKKDESVTKHIIKGLEIVQRSNRWVAVADYFNQEGIPTGPYCKNEKWDGVMANRFYHNPILKGMPQRGAKHSVKHYSTGRRISVTNPAGPTFRKEPHLAFFSAEEIDAVLEKVDAANRHLGSPGVQKRSRFPGQCAACWYCGRPMVWGGNGITQNLMCSGARNYQCWNSIGMNGPLAAEKIVQVIWNELQNLDGFESQLRQMVQSSVTDQSSIDQDWNQLQADESSLAEEKRRLEKAVRSTELNDTLLQFLENIAEDEKALRQRRTELERRSKLTPKLPNSGEELRHEFEKSFQQLARDSFEFGQLMRQVVKSLYVYNVQLVDGGGFEPRVRVELSLGEIFPDIEHLPEMRKALFRVVTLDVFEPPIREIIREDAVRLSAERVKQRDIAEKLCKKYGRSVHQATIQRSLKLHQRMQDMGLNDPYAIVTKPPSEEENKKMRRHRHKNYRFEPIENYERPEISGMATMPETTRGNAEVTPTKGEGDYAQNTE